MLSISLMKDIIHGSGESKEEEFPMEFLKKEVVRGQRELEAVQEEVTAHLKENAQEMASQITSLTQHVFNHYQESTLPASQDVSQLNGIIQKLKKIEEGAVEDLKAAKVILNKTQKENEVLRSHVKDLQQKLKKKQENGSDMEFIRTGSSALTYLAATKKDK